MASLSIVFSTKCYKRAFEIPERKGTGRPPGASLHVRMTPPRHLKLDGVLPCLNGVNYAATLLDLAGDRPVARRAGLRRETASCVMGQTRLAAHALYRYAVCPVWRLARRVAIRLAIRHPHRSVDRCVMRMHIPQVFHEKSKNER